MRSIINELESYQLIKKSKSSDKLGTEKKLNLKLHTLLSNKDTLYSLRVSVGNPPIYNRIQK